MEIGVIAGARRKTAEAAPHSRRLLEAFGQSIGSSAEHGGNLLMNMNAQTNPAQGVLVVEDINGAKLAAAPKLARVVEEEDSFGLEYDNTLGKKNFMRLEGSTYERALREAKSFLEINEEGRDVDGTSWDLE